MAPLGGAPAAALAAAQAAELAARLRPESERRRVLPMPPGSLEAVEGPGFEPVGGDFGMKMVDLSMKSVDFMVKSVVFVGFKAF